MGPLLKFLKHTEVGSREGIAEKEKEWEQRRDQEFRGLRGSRFV